MQQMYSSITTRTGKPPGIVVICCTAFAATQKSLCLEDFVPACGSRLQEISAVIDRQLLALWNGGNCSDNFGFPVLGSEPYAVGFARVVHPAGGFKKAVTITLSGPKAVLARGL